MNKRRLAVMQRREILLERISVQRDQLSVIGQRWQPALKIADQGIVAVGFLRAHPVLVAGLAGLAIVRRSGAVGLIRGGLRLWRVWRYVSSFAKKL